MAPLPVPEAGPLILDRWSVGLTAEESRNIELVLLGRIMHRRRAAMRDRGPVGPPGAHIPTPDPPAGLRGGGRSGAAVDAQIAVQAVRCAASAVLDGVSSSAFRPKPDRSESLHERHAALFGMIVVELAALRPNLVLRRQRQFVDARHARCTRHAFGCRWNKRRGHRRLGHWRICLRRFEQRRLHRHRPN